MFFPHILLKKVILMLIESTLNNELFGKKGETKMSFL